MPKPIEIKELQVSETYPYPGDLQRVKIEGETTLLETFVAEGVLKMGDRVKVLIVKE
jgi:hypothetical protein